MFSGLSLGMLLAALDQTVVATALPTIASELDGLANISWIVTAYLLASTVTAPLYGKLGDIYGRRRLFTIAIVIFLTGSVLCGVAQTMPQLIVCRAIQGAGGGGLIVLAQAILADVVSPRERGRYQGYIGAVFAASSVAGPLLGGFLTDHVTWRWIFYLNLPLGAVALVATASVIPGGSGYANRSVDIPGSMLVAAAVACFVLATTLGGDEVSWVSPEVGALLCATMILVLLLVAVERRASDPVVPLALFQIPTFRIATSVGFATAIVTFAAITYLPLYLQVVNGSSAARAGLFLVPLMGGMLTGAIFAGNLTSRTGRYKAFPVVGTGLTACVLIFIGGLSDLPSRALVVTVLLTLGWGLGLTMQTLILATQNVVAQRDLGVATSSVHFFRALGGSVGVALYGALFNDRFAAGTDRLAEAIRAGRGPFAGGEPLPASLRDAYVERFAASFSFVFLLLAPLMGAAFILVLRLREVPLRRSVADAPGLGSLEAPVEK